MKPPIPPPSFHKFAQTANGSSNRGQTATKTKTRQREAPPANRPTPVSLDVVPLQLRAIMAATKSETQLLQQFVNVISNLTNSLWCGHYCCNKSDQIVCDANVDLVAQHNLGFHQSSLLPTASAAIDSGKAVVTRDNDLAVIAAPVLSRNENSETSRECFCVALNLGSAPVEPFLLTMQLVAATLGQWRTTNQSETLDWQVASTAAIAELMSKVVSAKGNKAASLIAANELATFLQSPLVAIGYVSRNGSRQAKLNAVSGVMEIDASGKQTRILQAVFNEALVRGSVSSVPSIGGEDRCMKLAHQKLLQQHPASRIVSAPLQTTAGETVGAWLCLLPDDAARHEKMIQFASATSNHLADALQANRQASMGVAKRISQKIGSLYRNKKGQMGLFATIAIAAIMMIPVTHRIDCNCQLVPTHRRFAVAPHDGILLESIVKPGDIVTSGQTIATMDDRELSLQLADLLAQKETALKKRDVHRSYRDAAETQIAELETEQLDAQIELLNFRKSNLEVKSKVDGIVLQGELEDAQGAPVHAGDVLMEIAPLEQLRLEVNVSDADIAYVEPGQSTTFVLDGTPFETLSGKLESIDPTSSVRDGQNVFVSEFDVDNQDRLLRPGMQGRAKIATQKRALGWVLFHRPAERVYKLFR